MKSGLIAIVVVVLVAVAGVGGFFAGNSFGPNAQAQNIQREFFQQRSGNGAPGGAQNGQSAQTRGNRPAANGTVKSVQGNTIQLTMQDGSVVTVNTDAQTVIQKTVTGAVSDIQPGQRITVFSSQVTGTPVPGTAVLATDISIQPSGQAGQ
jgi:hypothetical protein